MTSYHEAGWHVQKGSVNLRPVDTKLFSANCYDLLISIRNHSITPGIGFSPGVAYAILPVAHKCIEKQNDILNPSTESMGHVFLAIKDTSHI